MKRRLPMTIESGSLLAASSRPPVTSAAKGHRPGGAGPARACIAANADAIAPSARPAGSTPPDTIATPDSSTAVAAKPAVNIAARRANRRTQSRTVL